MAINVLGVGLADLTMEEAVAATARLLHGSTTRAVYFVNAHTLNLATSDPSYRVVLNAADLVLGDGTGVRWAARLKGVRLKENLCGTDFTPRLLRATAAQGLRYYMLGGTTARIERAARAARAEFQGWELVGYHHGYLTHALSSLVVDAINTARPDLLLVGMGNPIQERWIHDNRERLRVPVCIGVGGLFQYWAGDLTRAPHWLRRMGHEWLHVLLRERHKACRYLVGNPRFLFSVVRDRIRPLEDRRSR